MLFVHLVVNLLSHHPSWGHFTTQHLDKQNPLRSKYLVPDSFPLAEVNFFLKGGYISDFIFFFLRGEEHLYSVSVGLYP